MPADTPAALAALLDDLERLYDAATPGPWAAGYGYSCTRKGDGFCPGGCNEHRYIAVGVSGSQRRDTGLATTVADCGDAADERLSEQSRRDAEFIAALRNAFPALLAAARRGEEDTRSNGTTIGHDADVLPQGMTFHAGELGDAYVAGANDAIDNWPVTNADIARACDAYVKHAHLIRLTQSTET